MKKRNKKRVSVFDTVMTIIAIAIILLLAVGFNEYKKVENDLVEAQAELKETKAELKEVTKTNEELHTKNSELHKHNEELNKFNEEVNETLNKKVADLEAKVKAANDNYLKAKQILDSMK